MCPKKKNIDQLLNQIHKTVLNTPELKAMAVKRNLVFLKISGVGLEETHGIIGKISETLRLNSINISGILTITSSIMIFVDWNEKENALELIKNALRREKEMNPGKKRRLARILKQDDRTVIVPMDHGVSSGPLKGIENMQETINRLMAGGADAFVLHKGIAKRVEVANAGLIVHLSATSNFSPNSKTRSKYAA